MPAYLHQGRVAFHETDAAGIVHFANYFLFAEEAETAARATLGLTAASSPYAYPRVHVEAGYTRPLRFFECYEVRTTVTRIGESSTDWHFDIRGEWGGEACVRMVSARRHVKDGSRAPYSAEERAALTQLFPTEGE